MTVISGRGGTGKTEVVTATLEAIKDRMIEDQKRKDEEEAKEMSLVRNK